MVLIGNCCKEKVQTMEKKPYKKIKFENNHCLEIFDDSRKIGEDAYVVIMTAKMEIPVEKKMFTAETVTDQRFEEILETLGSPIVYTYKVERNMIMANEKDEVLESLVSTFLDNTGQYVAKPQFPEKLVLKEYRERIDK
jgi:archaellum biogenesis ATPase FlaH